MGQLIKMERTYADWISDVSGCFRSMQIKAATKVNSEMLRFYWSLGRDVSAVQAENRYGSGFLKNLSADFRRIMPTRRNRTAAGHDVFEPIFF